MKKVLIILIIFSISFTGCWDQKIYEKIGFILQVGIETAEDNKLLVSYNYPIIGADNIADTVFVSGTLLREAREKSRQKSPLLLEGGKIQQLLFSKEIAEKGIEGYLEIFQRDPSNPSLANVVVVDGSPNELMVSMAPTKNKPRVSFYINSLLESNVQSSYVPEMRVYNFYICTHSEVIDPITPIIKHEGDEIRVLGTALFSRDKMVGRIDTQQTSMLLAMMNKMKRSEHIFNVSNLTEGSGDKGSIAIFLRDVKRKLQIHIDDDKVIVNISLDFDGVLDEYKLDNISNEDYQEKIEKILSKELKENCESVLKHIQSVGCDPIGIGDIFRAKYPSYWKEIDWKDVYKKVQFNVDTHLEIMQYGVVQ